MHRIGFLFIPVHLKKFLLLFEIHENNPHLAKWRKAEQLKNTGSSYCKKKKKDGWTMFLSMETKENQSKCQQKSQELLVWKSKESF